MYSRSEPTNGRAHRPINRHWSIARRLTLLYSASTLLMLVLATAYLYWSLAANLERADHAFLANKIQECRQLCHERPDDAPMFAHEVQTEAAASQFIRYYVRLLDTQGQLVLETPGMTQVLPPLAFPAPIGLAQIPSQGTLWKSPARRAYLLMAALGEMNTAGHPARIIQVALDVSADEALIAGYRWKLLTVVVLGLTFAGAASGFVVRKGLRPLQDITQAVEHITASQLHERVVARGWPEELASLARSFDRMLDRLEASFKRLSQFSADLAHELRTPINNLRGEAGVALSQARTPEQYRQTLESGLEEYARLGRLIDSLLFLARADGAAAPIARADCDARQAIEGVRDFYEALAEDRGVELRCEGQGIVSADPVLFRQAVSNLLSNALNYTPRGGHVAVKTLPMDGGGIQIVVADTGCGIGSEHQPRIFDRLYRADPSRSQHPNGAGLGLAIVRSIMALHGGTVEVQSRLGHGCTFTLDFPPTPAGLTKP